MSLGISERYALDGGVVDDEEHRHARRRGGGLQAVVPLIITVGGRVVGVSAIVAPRKGAHQALVEADKRPIERVFFTAPVF